MDCRNDYNILYAAPRYYKFRGPCYSARNADAISSQKYPQKKIYKIRKVLLSLWNGSRPVSLGDCRGCDSGNAGLCAKKEKGGDKEMIEEEMWKAVSENDVAYDGIFFYAVKSTGIYCRPSCKSKRPKRENVRFFDTAEQAKAAGFRPCKRCRSDLLDYQPIKEIAEKAKRLLDDYFQKNQELNQELRHLGISQRRMVEIFKDEYGVTLSEYVGNLRLTEAKRLLSDTNDEIVNIAYSVGFSGLSSFYRFFKTGTGLSPAAYRKEHRQ